MSDPGVCARCARQGPTCCRLTPGDEESCFPVSEAEKERIREVCPDKGGFVVQPNSAVFVDSLARLFPNEKRLIRELFPAKKFHMRLATDAEGACRFLGPRGCMIEPQARPYYCRVYPFWMVGERLTVLENHNCLAQQESKMAVGAILDLFDTGVPAIRDLYGRLRLAWGFPPREGMAFVKKGY